MKIPALEKGELPYPPGFRKMVGPSFILLGLGLGIGELILWPYLTANYGLGIVWGALLGITMQWFINMEISRYTLVTGESVFVGLARKFGRWMPIWFLISTIVPWMWPGIVLTGSRLLTVGMGWGDPGQVSMWVLVVIGLVLSLGPVLYGTQEKLEKILLAGGVPFILGLVWWLSSREDWTNLAWGLVGRGDGYWFLPMGLQISAFLGAIVFSGAGGNLNLGQSQNIKEKGYGMGHGSGRITSLLTGKQETIHLVGKTFETSSGNMNVFQKWWRLANLEQGVVFWMTGLLTMLSLALLAYVTIYGQTRGSGGVDFVVREAGVIGERVGVTVGSVFLVVLGLMLLATQLSVLGTTGKIMAENWAILNFNKFTSDKLPRYFYAFLWLQIGLMLLVLFLGFKEPFQLVLISAVLNAWTMVVYTVMILWLNTTVIDRRLRPSKWRVCALVGTVGCFVGLGVLNLVQIF